jgi:hypothetical protein
MSHLKKFRQALRDHSHGKQRHTRMYVKKIIRRQKRKPGIETDTPSIRSVNSLNVLGGWDVLDLSVVTMAIP